MVVLRCHRVFKGSTILVAYFYLELINTRAKVVDLDLTRMKGGKRILWIESLFVDGSIYDMI